MKLLVTGGAGFIGSNFIHYWLTKYPTDSIINLDALTYAGNLDSLKDLEDQANYQFVQGNICDLDLVNDLVAQVDLIVHFAAESHVDRSIADSTDFIKTNVEGTRVLLEVARKYQVRFHHISTDEVFGALDFSEPAFTEASSYDPHSPYSASKAAADHLVRAYYHTYQLPITISNCSNNYGPYQHPEKFIPRFITNLLTGQDLPLYGSGANIRDWIHVDDHNAGVEAIIKQGQIGETYCLGGNSERSNLQVAKQIVALLEANEKKIVQVADRPGHDLRYAINIGKIKEELGWQPQINFTSGLKKTIDWYKNNTAWWKKLKK